jgi:hypothetical protein
LFRPRIVNNKINSYLLFKKEPKQKKKTNSKHEKEKEKENKKEKNYDEFNSSTFSENSEQEEEENSNTVLLNKKRYNDSKFFYYQNFLELNSIGYDKLTIKIKKYLEYLANNIDSVDFETNRVCLIKTLEYLKDYKIENLSTFLCVKLK